MITKSKAELLQQHEIISVALELENRIDKFLEDYNFSSQDCQKIIPLYHSSKLNTQAIEIVKGWYEEIGWEVKIYLNKESSFRWIGKREHQ